MGNDKNSKKCGANSTVNKRQRLFRNCRLMQAVKKQLSFKAHMMYECDSLLQTDSVPSPHYHVKVHKAQDLVVVEHHELLPNSYKVRTMVAFDNHIVHG